MRRIVPQIRWLSRHRHKIEIRDGDTIDDIDIPLIRYPDNDSIPLSNAELSKSEEDSSVRIQSSCSCTREVQRTLDECHISSCKENK